jgi:hypothetical protein
VSRIVYISGRPGAGKSSIAFPLAGIGPLITVDTTRPVDVATVAAEVRRLHTS